MTEEARPKPDSRSAQGHPETIEQGGSRPVTSEIARFYDEFGDPVEIYCGKPLPEYNCGPVKAYMARGRAEYFALVCEKQLIPRLAAVQNYKTFTTPLLAPLISNGITYWPPAREERYVFLYRNILGKRIHTPGSPEALGWRQETVMEIIVKPMTELFKTFKDATFVHGAIRPSNMFADTGSSGKTQLVMLGDCLALPASYLQPVLYEPIERAMAHPIGRGQGTIADDLYSFGVSLAVILRSHDPLQEMNDQEIIKEKLEFGSYSAITGRDRFKGSILELLRGLLHDEAKERWTIEEVMTWLDGRRLSPKQPLKRKKAARPISYEGQKYLYSSTLAIDIDKNPQETVRIVNEGDLDQWLVRSLEDEEIIERVEAGIKTAREKGTGPGYEERLTANLSIAMDPFAPIRYKGLRLMGEGIGTALAEAAIQKQDVQRFVELFSQGIAFVWLTSSKNSLLDQGSLISRFDQCRNYIRHGKAGYGVERCIYTMCPECPCLSEKLRGYYIQTPEDMLRAFEDLCQKGSAPAMFMDRHSMAFLSAKEPKVIDPFLFELGSSEEHRRILGNLKCLGAIQKRFNMPNFPGIAKVFSDGLPAVYARYHDRGVREKLESTIRKFVADGDLSKMATLLSNADVAQKDFMAFRNAMLEYKELTKEYNNLVQRLRDKGVFGKTTGKEFAAIISSAIAAAVIVTTAFMFLSTHSTF
jgi:hypothetical protein